MDKLIKEITAYIISITKENNKMGKYMVEYADIHEQYGQQINEVINAAITKELESRKEVSDVQEDTDGFDVTLCTDYAPNYIPEDEE